MAKLFLGDRPSLQSPRHHSPHSTAHNNNHHAHANTHAETSPSNAQNRLEAIRKPSPPPSASSSPTSCSPRSSPPPPSVVREASPLSIDTPPDALHQPDYVPQQRTVATQEAEPRALSPAVVLPGVWHFANLDSANSTSSAYALSISASGQFELWERTITAAGVELRGMAGLVSVLSCCASEGRPSLAIRLTKTAERLVCSGGESTSACAPQAADGTVVSIDEATQQVALKFHAFGTHLIFWRACQV